MSGVTRSPFAKVTAVKEARRWPGLEPYSENDADRFFGRREEISDLALRVERRTLTVLFAQSGLGKTSVLRAGLFPTLRKGKLLPIYIRLDHAEGTPTLVEQVFEALRENLATGLEPAGPGVVRPSLWEWCHDLQEGLLSPRLAGVTPVLVFDQFEEIFTIGARNEEQARRREEFLTQIADLAENRMPAALERQIEDGAVDPERYEFDAAPYRLLLALREDYLSYLDREKGRIPSLMANRMPLDRLTGRRALEVVTGPAPDLVTPEVAEQIVRFVAGEPTAPLENFTVEPPLLSLVCQRLDAARNGGQITTELLTGKREEILTGYYEECFAGLDPRVRVFVEDELVTESGHRESMAAETAEQEIGEEAIQHLVDHRLLHTERRGQLQRLELTHDILAKLVVASRSERRGREQEAAQSAAQTERLRRIRKLLLGAVAALVVVVALPLAVIALYSASRARANAREAELQATVAQRNAQEAAAQAEAARRAEEAAREARRQAAREAGYFYAREALKLAGRQPESLGEVPQPLVAWGILRQGLEVAAIDLDPDRLALLERLLPEPSLGIERRWLVPGGVARLEVSSDGAWAAALRADGTLVAWRARAPTLADARRLVAATQSKVAPWQRLDEAPSRAGAGTQASATQAAPAQGVREAGAGEPPTEILVQAFTWVSAHDGRPRLAWAGTDGVIRWIGTPDQTEADTIEVSLPPGLGLPTVLMALPQVGELLVGTTEGLVAQIRLQPSATPRLLGRSRFSQRAAEPPFQTDPRGRYLVAPTSAASRWRWHDLSAPYGQWEMELPEDATKPLIFEESGDQFAVVRKGTTAGQAWAVTMHRVTDRGQTPGTSTRLLSELGPVRVSQPPGAGTQSEATFWGGFFLEPGLLFVLDSTEKPQLFVETGGSGRGEPGERGSAQTGSGPTDGRFTLTESLPLAAGPVAQSVWSEATRRFALREATGRVLVYQWQKSEDSWQLTGGIVGDGSVHGDMAFDATGEHLLLWARGASAALGDSPTIRYALKDGRGTVIADLETPAAWLAGSYRSRRNPVLDLQISAATGMLLVTTAAGLEWWTPTDSARAGAPDSTYDPASGDNRDWAPRGYQSGTVSADGLEWRVWRREAVGAAAQARLRWSPVLADSADRTLAEEEGSVAVTLAGAAWAALPNGGGWLCGSLDGRVLLVDAQGQLVEALRLPEDGLQRERLVGLQVAADGASAWVVGARGGVVRLSLQLPTEQPGEWARSRELQAVVPGPDGATERAERPLWLVYRDGIETRLAAAPDRPGIVRAAPGIWQGRHGGAFWWQSEQTRIATDAAGRELGRWELPSGATFKAGLSGDTGARLLWTENDAGAARARWSAGGAVAAVAGGPAVAQWKQAGWLRDGTLWVLDTESRLWLWQRPDADPEQKNGVVAVAEAGAGDALHWLQEETDRGEMRQMWRWRQAGGATGQAGPLPVAAKQLAPGPSEGMLWLWDGDLGSNLQLWSARERETIAMLPQAVGDGGWVEPAGMDWVTVGPRGPRAVFARLQDAPRLEDLQRRGGFTFQRVAVQSWPISEHQRALADLSVNPVDAEAVSFWQALAWARQRRAQADVTLLVRPVDDAWADIQVPWTSFRARYPESAGRWAAAMQPWIEGAELPPLGLDTDLSAWRATFDSWGHLGTLRQIGPLQAAINRSDVPESWRRVVGRLLVESLAQRLATYPQELYRVGGTSGDTDVDALFAADLRQFVTVMNGLYPWTGVQFWNRPADYPSLESVALLLPRPGESERWQGLGALELQEWEVRLDPDQGDYWNRLGVLYEQAGRNAEGRRCFEIGAAARILSPYAVANLANLLTREGKPAEALALFARVPDEQMAEYTWRRRAEALDGMRRYAEAEQVWRQAVAAPQSTHWARRGLASNLIRQQRTAEALSILGDLMAGITGGGLSGLLEIYLLDEGDDVLVQRGWEMAEKILLREGPAPWLRQQLGRLLIELGEPSRARAHWLAALVESPGLSTEDRAWMESAIGESLLHDNRVEDALHRLDAAVTLHPQGHQGLALRAIAWQRAGKTDSAVASARAAVAQQSRTHDALLGRLLWLRRGPADAQALAELRSDTAPEAWAEWVWQDLADGRPESAMEWAQRILDRGPDGAGQRLAAAVAKGDFTAAEAAATELRTRRATRWDGWLASAAVSARRDGAGANGRFSDRTWFFLVMTALRGAPVGSLADEPVFRWSGLGNDPRWPAFRSRLTTGAAADLTQSEHWLAVLDELATLAPAGASGALDAADWRAAVQVAIDQAWVRGARGWRERLATAPWVNLSGFAELAAACDNGFPALQARVWNALTSENLDRSSIVTIDSQNSVAQGLLSQIALNPTFERTGVEWLPLAHQHYLETVRTVVTLPPANPGADSSWIRLETDREDGPVRWIEAFAAPTHQWRGSLTSSSPQVDGKYREEFILAGERGGQLQVELRSGDFDAYLHVFSPSGREWTDDDGAGGRNARLSLRLMETGDYRLVATSYERGNTGAFTLSANYFAPVSRKGFTSIGNALAATDASTAGKFYHLYRFRLAHSGTVEIDLHSEAFDTFLRLTGPGGQNWENDDFNGSTQHSRLEELLDTPGDYLITATSYTAEATGPYLLEIGGAGVTDLCKLRMVEKRAEERQGTLRAGLPRHPDRGFQESHMDTFEAGERITADLTSTTFDTYLYVYGPNGELIGENDDFGGTVGRSQVTWVAPEPGVYRIVVTSYGPDVEGAYELSWRVEVESEETL